MSRNGCKDSSHIAYRFGKARKRVVCVLLILERDNPRVVDFDQRPEQPWDVDHAPADLQLLPVARRGGNVLDMNIVEPIGEAFGGDRRVAAGPRASLPA